MLLWGTCSGTEGRVVLRGILQFPMVPSHCADLNIGNGASNAVCMMKARRLWGCQFQLGAEIVLRLFCLSGGSLCTTGLMCVACFTGAIRIPPQMYCQGQGDDTEVWA